MLENLKEPYEALPTHYQKVIMLKATKELNWSTSTFHRKLNELDSLSPLEKTFIIKLFKSTLQDAINFLESSLKKAELELNEPFKRIGQ